MKTFLIFPPHWLPTMPHLALPTLTAHLRSQGIEVIQRDLNVETFDTLLSRPHLQEAAARLEARPPASLSTSAIKPLLSRASQLADQVAGAKSVMRDARFYDGPTSLQAFLTLVQSLELVSLPFHPMAVQFTTMTPPVPVDNSHALLQAVRDPERNLFVDLFRGGILQDILREAPEIVGISISTMEQMLAGMTLAYLIKDTDLSCHVTIGGPHVSMLREQLPRTPEMFTLFDSAIVFSGETALLRLAEALDRGRGLAEVPNLIYRDGERIRLNPVDETAHASGRAQDLTPDFDGLPLDRYLTPTPVLPMLTSHGCYHGRCAFCNVGYGGPQRFRQLDPDLVVEQMRTLRERYGARHIFFADEALTPRMLRVMSTRFIEGNDDIHWCGCARFDPGLTKNLLETMAEGGCRMLLFGLETASETTIARMHKGTKPATMSRILRDSVRAGIWNHSFFFFGFPGETMEAAQETVDFVYAHQDAIHSGSPGAFLLERYAPTHLHPEEYGITHIAEPPERDLAIYFDYEVGSGLDEAMADRLASRLVDVLPSKRFGQFYITDVYRFLYASHLWDRGQPMPLWLADE
ncbi:MAG: B12-binding domain-containing radical SAM protein [Anaerolineae bacterium]